MERYEHTDRDREFVVAKRNDLFTDVNNPNMTLRQNRILNYMISKIQPDDDPDKMYYFTAKEFCDVVGIEMSTSYITEFYKEIGSIRNWHVWLRDEREHDPAKGVWEEDLHWFDEFGFNEAKSTIKFSFSRTVAKYLFNLPEQARIEKRGFTQYLLASSLIGTTEYYSRLYELCESWIYKTEKERIKKITIDELRTEIGAFKVTQTDESGKPTEIKPLYEHWYDFERYILMPAIKEINDYTEINVEYAKVKKGRSVYAVNFVVRRKNKQDEDIAGAQRDLRMDIGKGKNRRLEHDNINEKLEEQMTFEELPFG